MKRGRLSCCGVLVWAVFASAPALAVLALVIDLVFFAIGSLPVMLLIMVAVRTILLPFVGLLLGTIGGRVALRQVVTPDEGVEVAVQGANGNGGNGNGEKAKRGWRMSRVSRKLQLQSLSKARASEEAREVVPNDLPLRSKGATRFYLLLLLVFVLFYPALDPLLFSSGTVSRISSYGDIGYYIILALGLNIVVGFAGLLDLGYVAFFVIGSYAVPLLVLLS